MSTKRQPTQQEINRVFRAAFISSKRTPPARRHRARKIVDALHARCADASREFFQWAILDLHHKIVSGADPRGEIAALYRQFAPGWIAARFDVPELSKENDE